MNRLLSSLPGEVSRRLLRRAEKVELGCGDVLHEPYEQPSYAYFPITGGCSVITRTSDGDAVETAMLGQEGCTGVTFLLGRAKAPSQYLQQVAGVSLRIPFADLSEEFRKSEDVRDRMLALLQVIFLSMGQLVACQRLHHAEQRLARWLLLVGQRCRCDSFQLKHEFLGEMLGCGRPKVTLLLLAFREAGLVDSERNGQISIRDKRGLEATACECHAVITDLYADLYSVQTPPSRPNWSTSPASSRP